MVRTRASLVSLCYGTLALLATTSPALAQCSSCASGGGGFMSAPAYSPSYYSQPAAYGACSSCAAAPVMAAAPCEQTIVHQPIMQTCYQTVPVTEYQEVKQIVQRPRVETKYVDQAVTEYEPVVETKTCQVPSVSYQDHVEYRQVQRNTGYWVTKYQPNCKMAPCQVDSRPGLAGWWGRTSYQMKTAFQPPYTAHREYVNRTCVSTVPVTRRVAHTEMKQVSYNVTRMVAKQTTRRVAVNTVTYVPEEVTAMRPVTVMRTVPVGTQMAFAPMGGATAFLPYGASATALAPIPEPTMSAERMEEIRRRRASNEVNDGPQPNRAAEGGTPSRPINYPTPLEPTPLNAPTASQEPEIQVKPVKHSSSKFAPASVAQTDGWVARRPRPEDAVKPPSATVSSSISLADTAR